MHDADSRADGQVLSCAHLPGVPEPMRPDRRRVRSDRRRPAGRGAEVRRGEVEVQERLLPEVHHTTPSQEEVPSPDANVTTVDNRAVLLALWQQRYLE